MRHRHYPIVIAGSPLPRSTPGTNPIVLNFRIGSNTSSQLGWLTPAALGMWDKAHKRQQDNRRQRWMQQAANSIRLLQDANQLEK